MAPGRISIIGAGSVGLTVGARLARSGEEVLFVTRRPEAARALAAGGVRLEDPASGESFRARVDAVAGIPAAGGPLREGPVLLCVRATDTEAAAAALAAAAPDVLVVSVQNDLGNCEALARRFARVAGCAYRQTCTRESDARAVTLGRGRLVLGPWPEGRSDAVDALAASFRKAGYDVGVSARIGEDLWLKLCTNLMSAPNALVVREDHESAAFVGIKVRLLEEAAAVLAAADIRARSCDGRDRSLPEEIAFQRDALARGTSARRLPVYNQVWSALRHGGPLEADGYHRRILSLAARHGVAAPQNQRILGALLAAHEGGRGPESLRAAPLLAVG